MQHKQPQINIDFKLFYLLSKIHNLQLQGTFMQKYRIFLYITLLACLSGCSWNTYTKADGSTGFKAQHSTSQAVYYEDGTYSSNMNYNQYRPVRHTLNKPSQAPVSERATWP